MIRDILGEMSNSIMKMYVVCSHWDRLIEAIIMTTLNIPLFCRKKREDIHKVSPFAS